MNIIKSQNFGLMYIKKNYSCGDTFIQQEKINNKIFNIYLGFDGYLKYYAVEA